MLKTGAGSCEVGTSAARCPSVVARAWGLGPDSSCLQPQHLLSAPLASCVARGMVVGGSRPDHPCGYSCLWSQPLVALTLVDFEVPPSLPAHRF